MPASFANRLSSRIPDLLCHGPKVRFFLGDISTKVLFCPPGGASTFVLHAAASASLVNSAGASLSCCTRDPNLEDVTP